MKRFVAVVLIFIMAMSALPVLAKGSAEDALVEVKMRISIPKELSEFNYSESSYDGVLRYDFTWNTKEYDKELYVSADSNGEIVSYNYYEQMDYSSDRTLIDYTIEDARPVAEEFVMQVYPHFDTWGMDMLRIKEESSYYSGRYKTFVFVFERRYMPYTVESNSVTVRVRATKDKMYIQSMNAALDSFDDVFDGGNTEAKYDLGVKEYTEKFPIDFYYAKDYSGEEDKVSLFYSVDKGFVSLMDKEVLTQVHFDRYSDKGFTTEDSVMMEGAAGGSANRKEILTEAEIKELEEMKGLVSVSEIEAKLRGLELFKITEDMVITSTSANKYDEKYMVYFTLKGDERTANVTYNGKTGEVISINTYFHVWNDEKGETVTREETENVKKGMESLATALAGDKTKETKTEFTVGETSIVMSSERQVNGIKYPENNISITYNTDKKVATNYRITWDEDVSDFPKVEEAISLEKASEILFKKSPIYKAIVKTEKGYIPAITIPESITINAITGEELYADTNEKVKYTDIDSHWAKDIINVLWEHDIYLAGDKFNPDSAITQADMIALFSACRDSGVIPLGWTKERIAQYGVEAGFIETEEPDKEMSRKEAFGALVSVLGYGEVAKYDIYKSSYSDMDADGSAEILKAMGILEGDIARPDDYLTRAEAAVMVYRYLRK